MMKFEYDVFISYRTSMFPDRPVAEELQQLLERFPVPGRLKKNVAVSGRWRTRLKVFRDITDLSASSDLNEAIQEKLRLSRFLIVVCTPNIRHSPYCTEEIGYFREHHGDERVLPLLVQGEPSESFPTSLVSLLSNDDTSPIAPPQNEPIRTPVAADVRAEKSEAIIRKLRGRGVPKSARAMFKLLAPILGCKSPDELVQRDRARVRRQVSLAVSVLVAFVLPILLWNFYTFQLEFADQAYFTGQAYEDQRTEVLIVRRFNPFGFQMGTGVFKDELATDSEAGNRINQRAVLSRGLFPDWNPLGGYLNERRLAVAEDEWLDISIEHRRHVFNNTFDVIPWARASPAVIEALFALCKDKEDSFARSSAADSLGRLGKSDAMVIEVLVALLKDDDRHVRCSAADSLGRLGKSDATLIAALVALLQDQDSYVRFHTAASLGQLGKSDAAVIAALVALLKDDDRDVRASAALALGQLGKSETAVIAALVAQYMDQDRDVRERVAESLGQLGKSDATVIAALVALLKDGDIFVVRSRAAESMVQLGKSDAAVITALVELLKDQDSDVRFRAAESLVRLGSGDAAVIDTLVALLKDQDREVRLHTAVSLGRLGKSDTEVTAALVACLKDDDPNVRSRAANSLGRLGKSEAAVIAALVACLKDDDILFVRSSAAESLMQLGKMDAVVIDTLLQDQDSDVRSRAAESLVQLGMSDAALIQMLVALLKDQQFPVRERAAATLVELGRSDAAVIQSLIPLLKDEDHDVRLRSAEALVQLGKSDAQVIEVLLTLLKDQEFFIRSRAAASFGKSEKSDATVIAALVTRLRDRDRQMCDAVAASLGKLGQLRDDWTDARMLADFADYDSGVRERAGIVLAWRDDKLNPQTIERVRALRKDSRPWVRQAALHALYHIEKRKAELEEESKKAEYQNQNEKRQAE